MNNQSWSDGHPVDEDEFYTYRAHEDGVYTYHADDEGEPFLCPGCNEMKNFLADVQRPIKAGGPVFLKHGCTLCDACAHQGHYRFCYKRQQFAVAAAENIVRGNGG